LGRLTVRCGKNIPRRPVLWMWPGRIPKNKVTLIQGDGGEGKSSFALFFGAGMSVGKAPPELINGMMMDSEITDPINVFYVSTEDESEDTALPRFLRFGGDEERYYDNDEKENHFEMTEECLEEVYKACHPGIIIIDPYQSFLPDGVHLGNLGEMRKVIAMMMRFSARREVTILLIGHLNKNEGSKDIHRGYGSGDIAAAMRNIIKIEVDKKNPTKRTLRVIKSNLDGACFEPVGIRQDEEKKIYLCNPRENGNENQIDLAVQIIQSKMKNDRALADEVDALMGEAGIQSRTVGRAQSRMNVRRKKIGGVSYLVKKEPKPENDV